jgi:excisionase family DNA binding protein
MSTRGTPMMRETLETILHQAQEGDVDAVIHTAQKTLQELDGSQLLTTSEAARLLGIRSVNTLKALVMRTGIPYQRVGNRMMLPLAAVEQLKESTLMRGLRASEALHDSIEALGPAEGLSADEMRDLEAARPGRLPWKSPQGQDEEQGESSRL